MPSIAGWPWIPMEDLIETPVSAALNTGERRLSYVVTAIRVLRISPR